MHSDWINRISIHERLVNTWIEVGTFFTLICSGQETKYLSYLVASVGSSDGSINCCLSLTMFPKIQDEPEIFSQVLASTELAPQDTHCEPRVGIPHGQTPEL